MEGSMTVLMLVFLCSLTFEGVVSETTTPAAEMITTTTGTLPAPISAVKLPTTVMTNAITSTLQNVLTSTVSHEGSTLKAVLSMSTGVQEESTATAIPTTAAAVQTTGAPDTTAAGAPDTTAATVHAATTLEHADTTPAATDTTTATTQVVLSTMKAPTVTTQGATTVTTQGFTSTIQTTPDVPQDGSKTTTMQVTADSTQTTRATAKTQAITSSSEAGVRSPTSTMLESSSRSTREDKSSNDKPLTSSTIGDSFCQPPPAVANSTYSPAQNTYSALSNVTYSCIAGYRMQCDAVTVTCTRSRSWDFGPCVPSCAKVEDNGVERLVVPISISVVVLVAIILVLITVCVLRKSLRKCCRRKDKPPPLNSITQYTTRSAAAVSVYQLDDTLPIKGPQAFKEDENLFRRSEPNVLKTEETQFSQRDGVPPQTTQFAEDPVIKPVTEPVTDLDVTVEYSNGELKTDTDVEKGGLDNPAVSAIQSGNAVPKENESATSTENYNKNDQ